VAAVASYRGPCEVNVTVIVDVVIGVIGVIAT